MKDSDAMLKLIENEIRPYVPEGMDPLQGVKCLIGAYQVTAGQDALTAALKDYERRVK